MAKKKNILVLTYWSYSEALIQAYTLPYLRIMDGLEGVGSITLVTLDQQKDAGAGERTIGGNIRHFPLAYTPFGLRAMFRWIGYLFRLIGLIFSRRIDVIHCWCTPAGSIGYLLSRLTGRPLIIDSYEPHAEAMVENGTWPPGSLAFKLLFRLERWQSRRAKHLIAASRGMKGYALEKYGVECRSFFVKPACVDLDLFGPEKVRDASLLAELDLADKLTCVYAGKVGGIYLEKEIFDFFKVAADHWGDRFRVLLLSNLSDEDLDAYCEMSGLDRRIVIKKFVAHAEVPVYMGLADFAFTPVKPVNTKRFCTPIKDGEYWALGLPVVITPNISDDSAIIESNGIGSVIRTFDEAGYRKAVQEMDELLLTVPREERYRRIREVARQYRDFSVAESIYTEIYNSPTV